MKKDAMIVALSCSGGSKNVVSCCHWAKKNGFKTAMIAGQDRQLLESDINNIVLDCKYFHTVEVLSLILTLVNLILLPLTWSVLVAAS